MATATLTRSDTDKNKSYPIRSEWGRIPIAERTVIVPRLRSSKTELIVSRHQEDLSWAALVPSSIDQITIYNKGALVENVLDSRVRIVNLPNVGREAHTWLYHWTLHRETLADVTLTAQGNPFEHSPDFLAIIDTNFRQPTTLTRQYKNEWPPNRVTQHDFVTDHEGIEIRYGDFRFFGNLSESINRIWFRRIWLELFCCPPPKSFYFGYGAMWAVPRDSILARPHAFWSGLLEKMTSQGNPRHREFLIDAWAMELMWAALYRPNTELPGRFT